MINAFTSAYYRYINILWTTWALLLLLGVRETGICTWKSDNLNPTSNSFFCFATPNFISYLSNITAISQGINHSPIKTIIIINSKAQNNRPHQKKSVYLQQKTWQYKMLQRNKYVFLDYLKFQLELQQHFLNFNLEKVYSLQHLLKIIS